MPKAKLPVVWSSDAEEDLFQIWAYLVRQAARASADRVVRDIELSCRRLESWPHSGRDRGDILPGMRSISSGPYVIFHLVGADSVEVVRVLHGRRDIEAVFAEAAKP
jgi:toxin ParE1/3/4